MLIDIDLPDPAASVLRTIYIEGGFWEFEPGTFTPPDGPVDLLVEAGLLAAAAGAVWLTGAGRLVAQQLMDEAGHATLASGRRE